MIVVTESPPTDQDFQTRPNGDSRSLYDFDGLARHQRYAPLSGHKYRHNAERQQPKKQHKTERKGKVERRQRE